MTGRPQFIASLPLPSVDGPSVRFPLHFAALVSSACFAACAPRPREDSIAIEFDFDRSTEPAAWIDVDHRASPTGITFEHGVDGEAVRFDGSGASIDVTNVDALPLTSALAVELSVNVADWKNPYAGSALLESIVSHTDDFTIALLPSTWTFRADLRSSGGHVRLEGGAVRHGTWQHVALVLDEMDSMARLFVDGVVVDQRVVHGRIALTPGIPLRIGTWFEKNQAYCGAVDNLRIWQRALTTSEIAEHARATRPNS